MQITVDDAGARVVRGGDRLDLKTRAWGREGRLAHPMATATRSCGSHCAAIERDGITETFTQQEDGFEHAWILHDEPPGSGEIRIDLEVPGARLLSIDDEKTSAVFASASGARWGYSDLAVFDADGNTVSAWMVGVAGGISIALQPDGHRWPIEVDPLISTLEPLADPNPAAVPIEASSGQAYDWFGRGVTDAGDIDGDGFDDILIGAYGEDDNGSQAGAVYAYYGSPSGIDMNTEQKMVIPSTGVDHFAGFSVAGGGDIDSDGFADVVVGAYGDTENGLYSGAVFVLYGSADGLDVNRLHKVIASDGSTGDWFGHSVDMSEGPGARVLVGAFADDPNGSESGSAYLYSGGPLGIDPASEVKFIASDGQMSDYFGWSVAFVGDSVIIGAKGDDDVAFDAGAVYHYTDASPVDETKIYGSHENYGYFGAAVDGAGDVNGDCIDDFIVGAPGVDGLGNSFDDRGSVYLFTNLISGVGVSSPQPYNDGNFGFSVSGAGDVNNDGFDDVIVGAWGEQAGYGAAWFYPGYANGLNVLEVQQLLSQDCCSGKQFGKSVSSAGDVNGDGRPAVLVGADHSSAPGGLQSGRAWVFYTSIATPRFTTLFASNGVEDDRFGEMIEGGDFNGDGYEDLAVGALGEGWNFFDDWGSVYIYDGGPGGIDASTELVFTASNAQQGDHFPRQISSGDANDDGYDDLAVAAEQSGRVYVYYGSANGLDLASEQELTEGSGVTLNGDFNGDGYDDLAAGDGTWSNAAGTIFVSHGGPAGIDPGTRYQIVQSDPDPGDGLGGQTAAADVNGDGYDDLLAIAFGDDEVVSNGGALYVFMGGPTGIDQARERKIIASDVQANHGVTRVARLGDINGDGYEDVAFGAGGDSDMAYSAGAVYVFEGSATGLDPATEVQIYASDAATSDRFGYAVSGGKDINGDGYDDMVVGAPFADTNEGAIYVFRGGESGFDPTLERKTRHYLGPDMMWFGLSVALLDDTDGDAIPDVAAGAPPALAPEACSTEARGAVTVMYGACEDEDLDGFCFYEDCDDADEGVGTATPWYYDLDGDGYGDDATEVFACDTPDLFFVPDGGDCADNDDRINPGVSEVVGDVVDEDCDGQLTCYADNDGDGFAGSGEVFSPLDDCTGPGEGVEALDCDDVLPSVFPGAPEICDDIDQDCDGDLLEAFADMDSDLSPDCIDDDVDGDGALNGADCGPEDPAIYPGAPELCDAIDSDCDGDLADGFPDDDSDGAPNCIEVDTDGDGFDDNDDCDPLDANVFPGAPEACDLVDSDCDGDLVEGELDTDLDGIPDCADLDRDGDGVDDVLDCEPLDELVYPGAVELCDAVDSDCDGDIIDEFVDTDLDGILDCIDDDDDNDGTDDLSDCDPLDDAFHPAAVELCDDLDHDCDGDIVDHFDDTDGDGDPDCIDDDDDGDGVDDAGDCMPLDPAVYPGAPELCDAVDSDCDGDLVEGDVDTDRDLVPDCADDDDDGDGVEDGLDCAPLDPSIHPGALDIPANGVDEDCSGEDGRLCAGDLDGDGFGALPLILSTDQDCTDPGESLVDTDCDDTDPAVAPGMPEICNGIDDDCDPATDENPDGDGDGVGFCTDCDDQDATVYPGAPELCDDLDNDCDGLLDADEPSLTFVTAFLDADSDGAGDPTSPHPDNPICDEPSGYVANGDDCDDTDADVHPSASEICDGIDNNCDGDIDEGCTTTDTDTTPAGDDDDDDDDPKEPGCAGCAQVGTGPVGGLTWSTLVLVVIGARRRRAGHTRNRVDV